MAEYRTFFRYLRAVIFKKDGKITYRSDACEVEKCKFPTNQIQVCKTCPFRYRV